MPEGANFEVTAEANIRAGNLAQFAADARAEGRRLAEDIGQVSSRGEQFDVRAVMANYNRILDQALRSVGELGQGADASKLVTRIRQYFERILGQVDEGVDQVMSAAERRIVLPRAVYEQTRRQEPRGGERRGGEYRREEARAQGGGRSGAYSGPLAEISTPAETASRGLRKVGEASEEASVLMERWARTGEATRIPRVGDRIGRAFAQINQDMDQISHGGPVEAFRGRSADMLREAQRRGLQPEGMAEGELGFHLQQYRRLDRARWQGGISGESPTGLNLRQIQDQLNELGQAARRAAEAERGVSTGRAGGSRQGFLRELLQASTLGAGGYRRFGHLTDEALTGGAARAIPVGLITGGAFTAFFALQQGITQAVREAIQLDRQFADLKDTVQSMGAGNQFDQMRSSLLGISDATGVAGSDVVQLAQGFLGLTGNVQQATEATRAAAQFIEVTGESAQQAGTQIMTIMQNMGISAEQAGSAAIAAGRAVGRSPADIAAGAAAIAPVGSYLGLNANQQFGLVAAAQKGTALTGEQTGTDLGRILEALPGDIGKLTQYGVQFQQPSNYRQDLLDLVNALKSGVLPQANQLAIVGALGGARNIQPLTALAQNPNAAAIISGQYTGSGALGQRTAAVNQTASESLKRLSQSAQTFANQVLNSGLGTTLADLSRSASAVLHAFGEVAGVFGRVDSALGDVPGHLLAVTAGFLILSQVVRTLPTVVLNLRDVFRNRRIGGQAEGAAGADAESTERQASTTAIQEEVTERQQSVGWLAKFWQAVEQASAALSKNTAAQTANSTATDADSVAHRTDAASTDADSAAHRTDAASTAADADAQRAAAGAAGANAIAQKGGAAAGAAGAAAKAAGGAEVAAEGAVVGGAAGGILGRARGALGRGVGAVPGVGGALTSDVTASGLLGLQGIAAGLAGFAAFEGTTKVLDTVFGKPQNVRPATSLTDSTRNFIDNFGESHKNVLDQLGKVGTPAQDKAIQEGLRNHDNTALLRVYDQMMNTKPAEDILTKAGFANPLLNAQRTVAAGGLVAGQGAGAAPAFAGGLQIGQGLLKGVADINFTDISDISSAVESGMMTFGQSLTAMSTAVNAAQDPVVKTQTAMQMFAIQSQHAATAIQQVAQFGQTIGGMSPTQTLNATVSEFSRQRTLGSTELLSAGGNIASLVAAANQYALQNTQATGAGAGFGQNILQTLLGGQGQSISGSAASRINQAYTTAGYAAPFQIKGGVGISRFTPQDIQAGAGNLTQLTQANTSQQVAAAQARQASQLEMNQIQTQGDQQVLATLQQIQAAHPDANLQPQIIAAQTKVAQDQVQNAQTLVQTIQAQTSYTQALQFQNPVAQAQTAMAGANQSAAALGTSVAQLQSRPFTSLSPAQQGVLQQWAQGQQQLFQSIGSFSQAEISLIQSQNLADPLRGAIGGLGQINAQIQQQFGSVANLQAQAAAGSQPAIQLLAQRNQQNFQVFQSQQQSIQAFWQMQGAQATMMGNSLQAAQANVAGAQGALDNFKRVNPGAANMQNAQYTQLVAAVDQAQGQLFQAQLQQMQAANQAQQARIGLTGNAPAVAALALQGARQQLAAFRAKFPSQANLGNQQYAQLLGAVYQAQGQYLETTISYNENLISEQVTNNQVSIGQAIQRLKALQAQAQAQGNFAEVEQIQTQIQQYINQGNENASFNLPANLNLPTLYEVRRTEGTPTGSNYYGNTGQVNVNINISNQVDVQPAVNKLMQAVGGPPTSGLNLPF